MGLKLILYTIKLKKSFLSFAIIVHWIINTFELFFGNINFLLL